MELHLCKHFYVMDNELEWKWIKGFENLYKIYIDGSVYSVRTKRFRKPETMRAGNGYLQVGLWKKYKRKNMYVHRLIALHFIENPNNYKEIDHINRISLDNRIENLRWCDRKTNLANTTVLRKNKNNTSGVTGVHFKKEKKSMQWYSTIGYDYKSIYIGYFSTKQEAIKARKAYELKISRLKTIK